MSTATSKTRNISQPISLSRDHIAVLETIFQRVWEAALARAKDSSISISHVWQDGLRCKHEMLTDICNILLKSEADANFFCTLDKMLLYILYRKEQHLLRYGNDNCLKPLSGIVNKYIHHRAMAKERILDNAISRQEKEVVIRRVYQNIESFHLVILLTHACQLRCEYCRVRKFKGKMDDGMMMQAIRLLFSSWRNEIRLQFFGGEPLLEFALMRSGVQYAESLNKQAKKDISYIVSTNGIALRKDIVRFLKEYNFTVEISLDGCMETQLKNRKTHSGSNYYALLLDNIAYAQKIGLNHYIISVVTPGGVDNLFSNFMHIIGLGIRRIQINYALGILWTPQAVGKLFAQIENILDFVSKHPDLRIELINLTPLRREPAVLNTQLTADCNGDIFYETGICLEEDFLEMKNNFFAGNVGKDRNINFFTPTRTFSFYLLSNVYAAKKKYFRDIILNNIQVGVALRRRLRVFSGADDHRY